MILPLCQLSVGSNVDVNRWTNLAFYNRIFYWTFFIGIFKCPRSDSAKHEPKCESEYVGKKDFFGTFFISIFRGSSGQYQPSQRSFKPIFTTGLERPSICLVWFHLDSDDAGIKPRPSALLETALAVTP